MPGGGLNVIAKEPLEDVSLFTTFIQHTVEVWKPADATGCPSIPMVIGTFVNVNIVREQWIREVPQVELSDVVVSPRFIQSHLRRINERNLLVLSLRQCC